MKKILLLLILVAEVASVYSQTYDLIVRTNGDSIVCKIDSILDVSLYFKMKSNNNWIQTLLSKNEVLEYKYNAIDWKGYVYKPGTSYILSAINVTNSVLNLHNNSVYAGYYLLVIPVIYERIIPLSDKIGLMAGGGVFLTDPPNPVAKTGIIYGNGKHFLEAGLYIGLIKKEDKHQQIPVIPELGYRYQSPSGFFFRGGFAVVLPGISIGYSF